MKRYKRVVSKDEYTNAWNQAGKNHFIYAFVDVVTLIAALMFFNYELFYLSLIFLVMSFICNLIFFRKIQKELFDKGIIEEV